MRRKAQYAADSIEVGTDVSSRTGEGCLNLLKRVTMHRMRAADGAVDFFISRRWEELLRNCTSGWKWRSFWRSVDQVVEQVCWWWYAKNYGFKGWSVGYMLHSAGYELTLTTFSTKARNLTVHRAAQFTALQFRKVIHMPLSLVQWLNHCVLKLELMNITMAGINTAAEK